MKAWEVKTEKLDGYLEFSTFMLVLLVCVGLFGTADGQGIVPAPQRGEICLNGDWQAVTAADENTLPRESEFTEKLPVPGVFNQWYSEALAMGNRHSLWYRLKFVVPAEWQDGRRVFIEFRSVDHYGKVYLNREALGEHTCGLIPFQFDITEAARFGQLNELLVYVEDLARTISTPKAKEEALAVPWTNWQKRRAIVRAPNDYPQATRFMPGVSGDVYLKSTPAVFISDVFAKPSVRRKQLEVQVWITNAGKKLRKVTVKNDVYLDGKVALVLPEKTIMVPVGKTIDFSVLRKWDNPSLWGYGGYGSATLYFVSTELTGPEMRDTQFTRFGFRELWAEGKDFYFNGKKWFLQGDCADDHAFYLHTNMRAFLARYLQAERQQNINNIRHHTRCATNTVWFDMADEMGMTLEPSTAAFAKPNPTNRKTDQWYAAECTKTIRNHPSVVIISTSGEAASQGGGAVSPGNDPEVWTSLKLVQDVIKKHDGTRLVCHDGSPRIMLSKKFGLDFPQDIWNIHPYGDPLVNSLRRHMQEFGYDGSIPCVIGELVAKRPRVPKDIKVLKEYPGEAYKAQLMTARYWAETIRDIKADGAAGIHLLHLMSYGYWGASSPTEISAGPYEGLPDYIPIPWPSRSGPGMKASRQLWGYKLGLVNYLFSERPLVVPNVIAQHVREAYREANGGKDLPPVPDRRAPEVIITVTAGGKPAANAYVYLEPLGGQATNVLGVMADSEGKAWFLLKQPGKYRVSCKVGSKSVSTEIKARYGSLKNDKMPWGHVDTFTLKAPG